MNEHQTKVFEFIKSNGGRAIPAGGGYWKTAYGQRLDFHNTTQAIYALTREGKLKRLHLYQERRRDTYAMAEEGQP